MHDKSSNLRSSVPVLFLGAYITALGSLRCLGDAGIPAYCLTDCEDYVRWSRFHRRLPEGIVGRGDDLGAFLRGLPFERAVLMPGSDDWVQAVVSLDPDLVDRFPSSTPSSAMVEQLVEKRALRSLLIEREIDHPRTVVLDDASALDGLEDGNTWFLKPSNSQAFRREFGRKAFRVSSLAEARERYAQCVAAGLEMVLQEYVPGPASNHYFIDGFIDRHGDLRGILARRRIRMFPLDFGDSSYIRTVEPAEAAPAMDACRRLLTGGSYRGIFSAEFKRDPRDDRFRLIEVNARPWAYVQFAASCGLNTPEMAYLDALGREVPAVESYRVGHCYQVMPNDLQAGRSLWKEGLLGRGEWLRQSFGVESAYFRWDDAAPALCHVLSMGKDLGRWMGWG